MAASSPSIHASLGAKVSRERVGKELEGMLTGKGARPGDAFDLIAELGLAGCMFPFPPGNGVRGAVGGVDYPPRHRHRRRRQISGGGARQDPRQGLGGGEESGGSPAQGARGGPGTGTDHRHRPPAPAPAQASGSEPPPPPPTSG